VRVLDDAQEWRLGGGLRHQAEDGQRDQEVVRLRSGVDPEDRL
jgi:hypothetical protein